MAQNENQNNGSQLIIVSNRLPFEIEVKEDEPELKPGSGGLVTALAPVLKNRGGIWTGWPGGSGLDETKLHKAIVKMQDSVGFEFDPVFLTKEQVDLYYHGFSNEIIWPLFHDLQTQCNFAPEYWKAYQEVNDRFAEVLVRRGKENQFIWVHDYQLMLVGQSLRRKGVTSKIGFFLHIPFPPLDLFMKLPWRFQVLQALLSYDLIGFQTLRDCRNFIQCVRLLKKNIHYVKGFYLCRDQDKETRIGAFPISIDFKEFADNAYSQQISEAAWLLHEKWTDQQLIFSLDRLDYTKGITYRLEAIRTFLQKYPEFHKKVCFIQVIIPSRTDIPSYQQLKQQIDRLVGEINSQYTQDSWIPIYHIFRHLNQQELLAYYRTSDVALVTPIKDGMNLVAKEYIACQIERNGVLILSEFAGAAVQLHRGALLVHPYDVAGIAEIIHKALTMPKEERLKRMRQLRRIVKKYDIFWWMQTFLRTAFAHDLKDFPIVKIQPPLEEYLGQEAGLHEEFKPNLPPKS